MNIVYEKKTDKTLADAMQALKENLKENGFGVLFELNFKDKLAEQGLQLEDDYFILEVCNPKEAKEVLTMNIQAGYVLPCKMVVRNEGADTYIGMTSPIALMSQFNQTNLTAFGEEIDETLKKAIDASL